MSVVSEVGAKLFGEAIPFASRFKSGRAKDGNALAVGADFGKTLFEVFGVAQRTLNIAGIEFLLSDEAEPVEDGFVHLL